MVRTEIGTATVREGVARTTYNIPSDMSTGSKVLYAQYQENDEFMTTEGYSSFEIRKATSIVVENILASINENVNFTATITSGNNQIVDEGQVQFYIDGNVIGSRVNVDTNGIAILREYTITNDIAEGEGVITAEFYETETYSSATSEPAHLTIRKNTNLVVNSISANRGSTAIINAFVTDNVAEPITMGYATLYIDNNQIGDPVQVNQLGKFEFEYPVAVTEETGSHTIKVIYAKNDTYDQAIQTATLIVRRPTMVSPLNVSANAGNPITLIVKVNDYENSPVTSGTVEITVDGETPQTAVIGTSGEASITYNVSEEATGTITYTARFIEDNNYQGSTTETGIITIRKETVIIVDSLKANVGDTVTLSSTVTSNDELVTTGEVLYELE